MGHDHHGHAALRELALEVGSLGEFNFLLSDGKRLFAHCSSRLCYIVRKAPFPVAHLADEDVTVDFNQVTTPSDRVAVIATTPLTDNEAWTQIPPGNLFAFHDGERVDMAETRTVAQDYPRRDADCEQQFLAPATRSR